MTRITNIPNLEGYGVFVDDIDFKNMSRREWMDLGPVDDWWSKGISRFSELSPEEWNSVHNSATTAAKELTFERLAERLEEFIESVR